MYIRLLNASLPVVVTVPPLLFQPVVVPEVIANIPVILVVLDTLPEDEIETPPEGIVQEILIEIEELIGDGQSAAKTLPEIIKPPERNKITNLNNCFELKPIPLPRIELCSKSRAVGLAECQISSEVCWGYSTYLSYASNC
jgi:hypothetical protein